MKDLAPEEFDDLFGTFEATAFRLMSHPQYLVDTGNERQAFEAFKRGEEVEFRVPEWDDIVSAGSSAGKTFLRVDEVVTPLSDYYRFLLTSGQHASDVGERVFVKVVSEYRRDDFWLFDDVRTAVMRYTADGEYLGASSNNDKLDLYRKRRDEALEGAVPLDEFLGRQDRNG